MEPIAYQPVGFRHVVAMSWPGRGHVNPMMNLCKRLVRQYQNLIVTFVVTEEWLGFIGSDPKPDRIHFVTLPNLIPSELVRAKDFNGFVDAVHTRLEEPFERLLDRLDSPPPTAIIADTYVIWAVRVGERRNIPVVSLWTMSATILSLFLHSDLLIASAEIAGDRKYDVYMGIDVFGRGSFGGGQWTANIALDLLKRNICSWMGIRDGATTRLFAPGRVYETEQPPDYHTAQNKWWSLVEKSWGIVQTYPESLPFYSDFNPGLGSHVSLGGRKLSDAPWYNISCQNLQPLLEFNEGKNLEIMQVTVDGREASYNGGGNVSFRGKLKRGTHFTARLFKPQLQLSGSPISVSYSISHGHALFEPSESKEDEIAYYIPGLSPTKLRDLPPLFYNII